jgi:hypothetical protein
MFARQEKLSGQTSLFKLMTLRVAPLTEDRRQYENGRTGPSVEGRVAYSKLCGSFAFER